MEAEQLLSFIGASLLLILMPGPDNIFVLVESITKGTRNAVLISIGLVLGVLIHTIIASTGLAIIIEKSPVIFQTVKYLGAVYLLYLAFLAFKEKQQLIVFDKKDNVSSDKGLALIRKGFIMNVLNPKVSLFFIAFLPQFINRNGFDITFQMVVLGGIFMILALSVFSLIAIISGKIRSSLKSPMFWKIAKFIKIGTFTVLGFILAFADK